MCNYTISAFICGCKVAGVKLDKLCRSPRQGCERAPQILILPRCCDNEKKHIHET